MEPYTPQRMVDTLLDVIEGKPCRYSMCRPENQDRGFCFELSFSPLLVCYEITMLDHGEVMNRSIVLSQKDAELDLTEIIQKMRKLEDAFSDVIQMFPKE